ncbi:MAG: LacI family transcriptional regulator [Sphingobacteriales bacterium]|nr:MAG: LacI family transcriptional regulator [Sphingobacteriales bacterium]
MDSVNIKELARKLNLSVSTVSKAFRKEYDINPRTRERILAAAKELNYQPNPAATSLRTQKSKAIAVIIPEIDNSFFVLVIKGIESIAQQNGYHVLIYLTHEDYNREVELTQNLQKGRVDGVLMSLSDASKDLGHLEELKQKGIPVIFFDRVYENDNYIRITTNDEESGFAATQHLIDQGCKKIVHFYLEKNLSISKNRLAGYEKSLLTNKMKINDRIIKGFTGDSQKSYEEILQTLKKEKPDGIFSSFEKLAMLCYLACSTLRLRIPEDIKIISFSNLEIASLLNPSLSTVTQPAFEIGEKAAQMLIDIINNKANILASAPFVIKSKLIVRNSSAR